MLCCPLCRIFGNNQILYTRQARGGVDLCWVHLYREIEAFKHVSAKLDGEFDPNLYALVPCCEYFFRHLLTDFVLLKIPRGIT